MRKIKVFLIFALAIICILSLLAFLFVNAGKNSEGAKEYKRQIKEESVKITETLVSEIDSATALSKEEIAALESDYVYYHEGQEDESEGIGISGSDDSTDGGSIGNQKGASAKTEGGSAAKTSYSADTQEKKAKLESLLKEKYYAVLLEQKAQAIGLIEALVAQGKSDYKALKAEGKWNTKAKAALVSDYMNRISSMEAEMDGSFETLIARMKENLEKEGLNSVSMIEEFRAEYSRIKEENRTAFADKLFAEIKKKS